MRSTIKSIILFVLLLVGFNQSALSIEIRTVGTDDAASKMFMIYGFQMPLILSLCYPSGQKFSHFFRDWILGLIVANTAKNALGFSSVNSFLLAIGTNGASVVFAHLRDKKISAAVSLGIIGGTIASVYGIQYGVRKLYTYYEYNKERNSYRACRDNLQLLEEEINNLGQEQDATLYFNRLNNLQAKLFDNSAKEDDYTQLVQKINRLKVVLDRGRFDSYRQDIETITQEINNLAAGQDITSYRSRLSDLKRNLETSQAKQTDYANLITKIGQLQTRLSVHDMESRQEQHHPANNSGVPGNYQNKELYDLIQQYNQQHPAEKNNQSPSQEASDNQKKPADEEKEDECCICMEKENNLCQGNCFITGVSPCSVNQHSDKICINCYMKLLRNQESCPLCRKQLLPNRAMKKKLREKIKESPEGNNQQRLQEDQKEKKEQLPVEKKQQVVQNN